MCTTPAATGESGLVRALGVRGLAASIVNTTVGAGIFVLPGAVAAGLGAAAPLAYVACGLTMSLIVTCIAMAGTRVALTGGLYAYVGVAFGPFVGFLAGVLLWLSSVLAVASIANALVSTLGQLVSPLGQEPGRTAALAVVFVSLAMANVRGVRTGARVVETLTLAKLLPLGVFVGAGLLFIDPRALAWPGFPPPEDLGEAILLLIFAFVGVEVALVPSGEVTDPSRTVPRALYLALVLTTLLYMAIQTVAQGVLGADMARVADAPLAEASARFLGSAGRGLVLLGTAISMFGYVGGDMLGSPRALFALGRDRLLPAPFARVHPRFHAPHVAIAIHATIALLLAVRGTFGRLLLISNVAVLSLYLLCCAAAWELRRRDVRSDGAPFELPGGSLVPPVACLVILWILSNATREELAVEGVVLGVATALYGLRAFRRRRAAASAAAAGPSR